MIQKLKNIQNECELVIDEVHARNDAGAALRKENAELKEQVSKYTSELMNRNNEIAKTNGQIADRDARWLHYDGPIPEGYELAGLRKNRRGEPILMHREGEKEFAYTRDTVCNAPAIVLRKLDTPKWRAEKGGWYTTLHEGRAITVYENFSTDNDIAWVTGWYWKPGTGEAEAALALMQKAVKEAK